MEIVRFHVLSDFKNLNQLRVNFKLKQNTHVLIGNNGAGKSNLLEAISSVFRSLYYGEDFEFDFHLCYNIDGKKVQFTHNKGSLKACVDGDKLEKWDKSILPSRVVCNYSGEDTRLYEKYYKDAYDSYKDNLIHRRPTDALRMIYVDKLFWDYILLIMLSTRGDVEAFDKFLKKVFKLKDNSDVTIKLNLNTEMLSNWGENIGSYYMRSILPAIAKDGTIDIENMNPHASLASDLFKIFVDSSPVINSLHININGYESSMLSEGEKKLMVVQFILEAIADESTLVLLDEPDSHIHVSRKVEMVKVFTETTNRQNIITSHSPTLTSKFPKESIVMLDTEDGHAVVVNKEKREIVEQLTKGVWTLQEQNIFLNSNDDILAVEGITDEKYVKSALSEFHKRGEFTDINLGYLPCGGAANVGALLEKFVPKENQKVIVCWDDDKAGFEAMKNVFPNLNKRNDFPKARKKGRIWYTFYPAWKKRIPNFNVEDYFIKKILRRYIISFQSIVDMQTKNLKNALAKDCENGEYNYSDFRHFEVLFKHLQAIKQADANGLEMI